MWNKALLVFVFACDLLRHCNALVLSAILMEEVRLMSASWMMKSLNMGNCDTMTCFNGLYFVLFVL